MSASKVTMRPRHVLLGSKLVKRREELKEAFTDEVRRLQKAQALLIATQFAANHEVKFDASDAMAAILTMVEQTLVGLDQLEVAL